MSRTTWTWSGHCRARRQCVCVSHLHLTNSRRDTSFTFHESSTSHALRTDVVFVEELDGCVCACELSTSHELSFTFHESSTSHALRMDAVLVVELDGSVFVSVIYISRTLDETHHLHFTCPRHLKHITYGCGVGSRA